MKRYCSIQTVLGEMISQAEGEALCGLWFCGQRHEPVISSAWRQDPRFPLFVALRDQLAAYFGGELQLFTLPLAPLGTPFQLAVWALLRAIPYGSTTTYGELARAVAQQRGGLLPASQAVGGAVGRNPLTIIVPCHRVVGVNGALTGYAGGLDRKMALLALEREKPR